MAGNTRGKLKEHLEGIHRNFEGVKAHVEKSLVLIAAQLQFTEAYLEAKGDAEKEKAVVESNQLYQGLQALGEGVTTFDEIAGQLYSTL